MHPLWRHVTLARRSTALRGIDAIIICPLKAHQQYEVEGSRPSERPKRTWTEVVREDCQARKLNKEDAVDRCKWRKVIKEVR